MRSGMLERLVHESLAQEFGQPLLMLLSLNDLIWFDGNSFLKTKYVKILFYDILKDELLQASLKNILMIPEKWIWPTVR